MTPYAVEVHYDSEFWPAPADVASASGAAEQIQRAVLTRLNLPDCSAWRRAHSEFDWEVDLRKFKLKDRWPGFFDHEITPANLREFEESFRQSVGVPGQAARAAEVVFWKSYGQYRNRERMTEDVLTWMGSERDWQSFCETLARLHGAPDWKHFQELRASCDQVSAFAVPITFLAFFDPQNFPLADRHVAEWWQVNQPGAIQFKRDPVTRRITRCAQSWEAYLAWAEFCRNHARRLAETSGEAWRARDVEMAVWTAQRKALVLRP